MGNESSHHQDNNDNDDDDGTQQQQQQQQNHGDDKNKKNNDDEYIDDPFDGIETLGYRVLGVQPNSPASKAGLVSFFDFLIGANQQMLLGSGDTLHPGEEYDDIDLPALLAEYKNQSIEFLVWNIKSQKARLVNLVPSDNWGGAGLLGVTIRLDNYAGADERIIRVLSVEEKSPAHIAGLVPETDYILGTTQETTDTANKLSTVLYQYQDQVIELYVYNASSDIVRIVALMPTYAWGGRGLLGAEIGTGYLHRLPKHTTQTSGTSIERKVRYVVQQPTTKNTNHNDNNDNNSDGPAAAAVLENEPQLEMEVPLSSDSSTGTCTTVQSVGEQGERTTEQQQQQDVDSAQQQQQAPSVPTSESQQQQQQQHHEAEETTTTSSMYDQPPPAATSSYSSFIAPPPKMHYKTPA